MNNQGQQPVQQAQGQQGQANPMAAAVPAAQRPNMYRPEMMRNLPILNDDEKTKYERGLRSLWAIVESHPEESNTHQEAKKKIQDFTKMLMGKLQARRMQMQQQQQQQQQQLAQAQQTQAQGQPPAPAQQQPTQQTSQPPSQPAAAPTPTQQQPIAVAPPAPQDTAQATASAPKPSGGPTATGDGSPVAPAAAAAAPPAPGQNNTQPSQPNIPAHILTHMRSMTFNAPPQIVEKGADAAQKWSNEMRNRYVRSLMTMEAASTTLNKMSTLIKDRQEKGNPLSADEQKQFQVRKEHHQKGYAEAQHFVANFRKTQEVGKGNAQNQAAGARPPSQSNAAQGPGGPAQQGGQASPTPGAGQGTPVAQGAVAAQDAKNQAGNPVNTPQQPVRQQQPAPVQQQQLATAGAPSQPTNNNSSNNNNINNNTASLQQQSLQNQQQPLPPQGASAATVAAAQMPTAGTPTQPAARVQTPQSALPAGASQALSHSAAVSRANQRVNSQVGGIAPQSGTGTPTPSGPGQVAAGPAPMANAAQPHMQPTPTPQTVHTTLQSKLPIPKHLPEKAQGIPQPVSLTGGAGAGRPTYTAGSGIAGGVMGQPAMQRIPAFSQEAEGDRVLSKKKLDELVRQVCGGTGEGQDGNLLSPEVEENVLNLADSFVDNVLNAACRNAKERGSKVLEIRDLQLVLERTYNIRVPGYSSDDLRTVRKVQPAPAWITKMSAIQAAKVTSGKTE